MRPFIWKILFDGQEKLELALTSPMVDVMLNCIIIDEGIIRWLV
jgi:hypothetical protein